MVLIIVSGLSGAGKSVALRVLEDMGLYCVDNLPIILLSSFINFLDKKKISAAVSIDIRNIPKSFQFFKNKLNNLPKTFVTQLLFLDADRKIIIQRYSDTRRLHPLSNKNFSLEKAIDKEQNLLEPVRSLADLIIDTSNMTMHELAKILKKRLTGKQGRELTIIFESFGFKYGVPIDADYVFDVRFLPNPHWNYLLRPMTGLDNQVIKFLENNKEVHNFIDKTICYLELWLPRLESNHRSYLTIAIGCTGGKHRSVYITEQLTKYFRLRGKNVQSCHKALEKINVI